MSMLRIIAALQALIAAAAPLPDPEDRVAMKEFLAKVIPALIDLVYDGLGVDELSDALASLSTRQAAGENLEAIGDGKILQWLVTNGPQILSFITMIIGLFPKQPNPTPAPVTPPAPSPVG